MIAPAETPPAALARRRPGPRVWVGLVALGFVFYAFPLLLDVPLVDPDEGLHAAIAQEMVERGDWAVPRFLGEPFLDKPILFFWTEALSLRALGMTETAVRLPGLAFGFLGTATTALLAWQLFGPAVGWLSGVLYATMLLPLALNQAAVHDVALIPWTNLAMLGLWRLRGARRPGDTLLAGLAAGLPLGLAVLTKGLVGVALVGLPFAVALALERRLTPGRAAAGVAALGLAAAIALPWYLAMERSQPGYLHYFFVERHLLGFATATQIHGDRPWWYYLPILAGGGLPWLLYLPLSFRSRTTDERAALVLMWVWVIVGLLLLGLAHSKLVTYLLPLLPAAAVLAAVVWGRLLGSDRSSIWDGRAVAAHALLLSTLVPAAWVVARMRFGVDARGLPLLGGIAAAAAALAAVRLWQGSRRSAALVTLTATMAVVFVTVMAAVYPGVARSLSARDLARFFNTRGHLPARVWVIDERIGSVVFYLDPSLRRGLTPDRVLNVGAGFVLSRVATAQDDVEVVLGEGDVARLERSLPLDGVPFDRAGRHRVYTIAALRQRVKEITGDLR